MLAGYWDVSYQEQLGAGMDCNVGLCCADMYNSTRGLWHYGLYLCVCRAGTVCTNMGYSKKRLCADWR